MVSVLIIPNTDHNVTSCLYSSVICKRKPNNVIEFELF
jgi:hypothetical protein